MAGKGCALSLLTFSSLIPQGAVIGNVHKRKGTVLESESKEGYVTVRCEVSEGGYLWLRKLEFLLFTYSKISLADMFGYSTELRANTQGKGEFSMEFARYEAVMPNVQRELVENYRKEYASKRK